MRCRILSTRPLGALDKAMVKVAAQKAVFVDLGKYGSGDSTFGSSSIRGSHSSDGSESGGSGSGSGGSRASTSPETTAVWVELGNSGGSRGGVTSPEATETRLDAQERRNASPWAVTSLEAAETLEVPASHRRLGTLERRDATPWARHAMTRGIRESRQGIDLGAASAKMRATPVRTSKYRRPHHGHAFEP
jgi:hypothetical protein